MRVYLTNDHPRAGELTAPLWPSRVVGGRRVKGKQATAEFDWSQPVAFGTLYETILMPAFEVVGLPVSRPATATEPATRGVRLHDLRHTFATMQLMAGVHFMQVSRWLGHGQPSLTLDVYVIGFPPKTAASATCSPNQSRLIQLRRRRFRRTWCSCSVGGQARRVHLSRGQGRRC